MIFQPLWGCRAGVIGMQKSSHAQKACNQSKQCLCALRHEKALQGA
jgi:hypothetical protein